MTSASVGFFAAARITLGKEFAYSGSAGRTVVREEGAGRNGGSGGPGPGRARAGQVVGLPGENALHELAGVGGAGRQRPGEALGGGELDGGLAALVAPQADEAGDGPAAAAEAADVGAGLGPAEAG